MGTKTFSPETLDMDERFVKDKSTGLVWHRVFSRVLYADTDRAKVVYHANYLRYFEMGRAEIMRDVAAPYKEVEKNGFYYPLVNLTMKFEKPLHYDDPFWVHTRPSALEKGRLDFEYIITNDDTEAVICQGKTIHRAIDKSGKPVDADPITVELWEKFPK